MGSYPGAPRFPSISKAYIFPAIHLPRFAPPIIRWALPGPLVMAVLATVSDNLEASDHLAHGEEANRLCRYDAHGSERGAVHVT